MGTSLYDQYLQETGGPTKPPTAPAPFPAPPPIAAPDITRVAPRPATPAPTEPLINRVARVNKAVRKALPLTDPLQQLEEGATKFGEATGYDLEAKRAQAGYAKAHPESRRAQEEALTNTAMLALQMGTGGAGEALPAKRALSDVPFEAYSRLEHAVDKAPFERGTAEQWKAALTPNVPAGERQWRGLDNLLEQKKGQVISRAELQGHLAENPIKVRASTYGGRDPVEFDEWKKAAHNDGWNVRPAAQYDRSQGGVVKGFVVERPDGVGSDFSPTREGAEEALVASYARERRPNQRAKFQQYKEPGGEDYTERVLRLEHNPPPRPPTPEGYQVVTTRSNSFTGQRDVKVLDPEGNVVTFRSGTRASDEDILHEAINSLERTKKPPAFKQAGHFPDENPLVHHRVTYHTVNGEKVAFVEEMQSDWHQKGRREGYRPREGDSYTVDKHPTDPNAFTILGPQGRPLTGTGTDLPLHYATIGDATEAVQTLQKYGSAVPDAPFKKTEEWTELALKDIIDQARANGATRVAWTTGEQQAARYDLSKHVDRIRYNPQSGDFLALKNGSHVHSGTYDPRALDDVIGKEAAENLLKSPADEQGTHTLEGQGLKVGGEGMRAYYDRLVPKVVKEYAKKRGVKIDVEPVELFKAKGKHQPMYVDAGEDVPAGQAIFAPSAESGLLGVIDEDTGQLRHNIFQQGHAVLDEWNPEDLTPPAPGLGLLDHEQLKEHMLKLQDMVDAGIDEPTHLLDIQPPPIRDQIMQVLELERVRDVGGEAPGGFEGTNRDIGAVRNARRRALRSEGDDEESPIVMQLDDIIARMRGGEPFPQAASASLAQLTSDMGGDRGPANIVAQFLGGSYNPRAPGGAPNQSFSLKGIPEGPQPLWAVGAAGAGTALALQQGDNKDKGGDLYAQFKAEQQKEGGDLYAQFKAEQPKPSVWDRLKSINAGVRQALVPDALQQLETGAAKFGKEQGEWGVQLAKDLKYVVDPARKAESGRPPTEETKAVDRRILFALATVALPAGVRKIFEDWVIARGIRPPAPPSAGAPPVSPTTAQRPTWDRSATAPPPVDQPQPLRPEQQALRARLATEGITPAGAIRRRPPTAPPPVEPGPEAQTFSTKGAVRRPAAAAPPLEAPAQPAIEPTTERRAEPRAPGDVWTPEQRAAYVLEQQRKFVQSTGNKLWSQWTPEEKAAYFADQDRVRAEIAAARAAVGPEEFQRRAIAAAAKAPGPQKMEAIAGAAHDIVAGETAHFPPEPKPGDLTPVVSSNSEFAARPGVMRDVNKGQQPTALNSPLRLPEPTPEDRAIVQPKGYKEISPEEVAARKPAPVVEATPKAPQPATVDENGLFFEHRTPGGELRDFRRVSTEGLIKAHREMQEQIGRDQQLAIYRTIENENMSGTGDRTMFQAATKTARGTSQQAEAAERLRNYQKVMDRLDAELTNRGMSSEDVYNAIQRQEEHEGAIEQEAIHHADLEDEAGTAFDFGDVDSESEQIGVGKSKRGGETEAKIREEPISDVLNVAKLNLGSKTAEQRMAAKLEEFRTQREANKQTFAEADVNRAEILNELRAGDPIALPTEKAKKLSGEELLARRDLVRENDQIIQGLSKRLEGAATPEEHQQASELLQKAVAHNDALLSDLVTGSSQKGRDLNLLRRMAQQSLDPDVWRVQAKRMLGDRPLTAEVDAMIRKLLQEATDACG